MASRPSCGRPAVWMGAVLALTAPAPLATAGAPTSPPALLGVQRPIAELRVEATIHIGRTADWVAVTRDAVWVGSTGPNAVSRIDPATNTVVAKVDLPGEPCGGLAPGPGALWVPLCGERPSLAKVDLKANRLAAVFPVGPAGPEGGVTVSPDTVWMITDKSGSLARIDPASGAVRAVTAVPAGSYNPLYARGVIYVTRAQGARLTGVEARGGKIIFSARTGPHPRFLAASPGAVWTLNQGDGSLTRVGTGARRRGATVALGAPGHGGDIAYGGGRIWTTVPGAPLSVVDAATGRVLRQWVGPGGDSLGVSPGVIWLTDYHAGTISRIRMADAGASLAPATKRKARRPSMVGAPLPYRLETRAPRRAAQTHS